jgi:hypothetical protein
MPAPAGTAICIRQSDRSASDIPRGYEAGARLFHRLDWVSLAVECAQVLEESASDFGRHFQRLAFDHLGRSPSNADSDEDAQAFRFDGALDSDMMSPRTGASLAGDWWHR